MQTPKPHRKPWPIGFPDVWIHADELAVKRHPNYLLAKLAQLREKHEHIETWWIDCFGFGFDCLTESEARYLIRTPDAEHIRDRILAAA